jgi:hypothetical protein
MMETLRVAACVAALLTVALLGALYIAAGGPIR